MNDILRNRLQAAYLAREPGVPWEERAARATEQWVEEQVGDPADAAGCCRDTGGPNGALLGIPR